jgi:uncharacterized membrane protein YeaQ/YmgE (transglycosylase-associated protein family)
MNKNIWFTYWIALLTMSIFFQVVGNTNLDMNNYGVIVAIFGAVILLVEYMEMKYESNKKK